MADGSMPVEDPEPEVETVEYEPETIESDEMREVEREIRVEDSIDDIEFGERVDLQMGDERLEDLTLVDESPSIKQFQDVDGNTIRVHRDPPTDSVYDYVDASELDRIETSRYRIEGYDDAVSESLGAYSPDQRRSIVETLSRDDLSDDLVEVTTERFHDLPDTAPAGHNYNFETGESRLFMEIDRGGSGIAMTRADHRDGYTVVRDYDEMLMHEVGHAKHYQRNDDHWRDVGVPQFGDDDTRVVASRVSEYAGQNSREYVAEVYTMAESGRADNLSDLQVQLYHIMEGPSHPEIPDP